MVVAMPSRCESGPLWKKEPLQAGRQAGRLNEASAMVLLRTHVALRAC